MRALHVQRAMSAWPSAASFHHHAVTEAGRPAAAASPSSLVTSMASAMDATRLYANCPPVVLNAGFSGSLALPAPDCVPLEPAAIDDPRQRARGLAAVDARGVLALRVRNREGHAFLRAHEPKKLRDGPILENYRRRAERYQNELVYYRSHGHPFVPRELLLPLLVESARENDRKEPISELQSNALAGVNLSSDGSHVVFFPTGQILQQACAYFSHGDNGAPTGLELTTKPIEMGGVIRQFAVMGQTSDFHPIGNTEVLVAARCNAAATILSVPSNIPSNEKPRMRRRTKLTFSDALRHIAGSPHVDAELAFITEDNIVQTWDPESGLQLVGCDYSSASPPIFRCEYSSHPRVLWTAAKASIKTLDLRAPGRKGTVLFDISTINSPLAEIYDLKRRSRSPFQFAVASGLAIEIVDTRMARQSLISWSPNLQSTTEVPIKFGVLQEIDMSTAVDDDRGAIVAMSNRPKISTVYPFEKSRKHSRSAISLQPLRYNDDDTEQAAMIPSLYVTSDASLDLRMEDGGELTHMLGMYSVRANAEGSLARVYQLNSLGDLFSHTLTWTSGDEAKNKSYAAGVHHDLPCGITATGDGSTTRGLKRKLPIAVDAILREPTADTLQRFRTVRILPMLEKYPRIPHESRGNNTRFRQLFGDEEALANELHEICQPSATLFRLHRYVVNNLAIVCSSRDLLRFLGTRGEFSIDPAQYRGFWTKSTRVLNAHDPFKGKNYLHSLKGDSRVDACQCSPQSSLWPCESLACIMPHALVVSSRMGGVVVEEAVPASKRPQPQSEAFGEVIQDMRAAYALLEDDLEV